MDVKAIRGMYDILPDQTPVWQYFEQKVKLMFAQYGYQEIRLPIVERTELFCRSIGEATDVVEKEMYTFNDRNQKSLTLRPEGTASCVRAAQENGLTYNQTQRLWYHGPMFRYERPQKGRQRQFHQFGAEVYGMVGPDVDAELIIMTARLWQTLGLEKVVTLQLNTLGSSDARAAYRRDLVSFIKEHESQLDADSQRRLTTNPLRVLDSKSPATQKILNDAPDFYSYLDEESVAHFTQLQKLLDAAGVAYVLNPRLVRGLDYYCKTVFEWTTDQLGAQGTLCGGGRYDGLVEQLGGKHTPGVGWAMGVERIILLLEELNLVPNHLQQTADVYIAHIGGTTESVSLSIADAIRATYSQSRVIWHCGGGSLKSQLKKADKSGADFVLILGEDELNAGQVQVKSLRDQSIQEQVALDQVVSRLEELLQ